MAEAEAVGRQCHSIRQNRPSCIARRPVSHCETTRFAWPHGWRPVTGRLRAWAVRPNCVVMQPPSHFPFHAHRPRPPPGAWRVGPRPWVSCCGCTMPNALYGMATDGLRGSETVVSVFAFGFAATSLLTVQPCCRLPRLATLSLMQRLQPVCASRRVHLLLWQTPCLMGHRLRQEASGSQPAGFCLPAAAPSGRCPRAGVGLRLCVAAAVAVARCRLAPCREQGCSQQGACRLCG